jgi:hypothetical protein
MTSFCEHGNGTSGSIKDGIFLDYLIDFELLKRKTAPWSQ